MKRGALLGASASVLALTWAGASVAMYWIAFGHRHRDDDDVRMWTPADFGVPHETLVVRTVDGIRLASWYLPGTRPAAVIVSGGYRSRPGDVLGISAGLQRAGFHVVVYGWRGTAGSDPAAHTLGVHERTDLSAVIDAVSARLGDVPIGLLGYSLGGSVSISVAGDDLRVRAVCSDSAFADPRSLLGDRVRQLMHIPGEVVVTPVAAVLARRHGARLDDFRPVRAIAQLAPRPVLIIHGEADQAVSVDHARRLYEAADEPKELWVTPGVGHVGTYFFDRAAYGPRIVEFFAKALDPVRPRDAKPQRKH